jgi:hypothetical protein
MPKLLEHRDTLMGLLRRHLAEEGPDSGLTLQDIQDWFTLHRGARADMIRRLTESMVRQGWIRERMDSSGGKVLMLPPPKGGSS